MGVIPMKKILAATLGLFMFATGANAEIRTYEGEGIYVMSDFETPEIAKERAKSRAEKNAQEQAGIWVESYLKVNDRMVIEDEIIVLTGGIMSVSDVKYSITPIDESTFKVQANLTAQIDSDKIPNWLDKTAFERTNLVEENKKLQQANLDAEKQIEELKLKLAQATDQTQREQITIEINSADQKLSANQKVLDAHNLIVGGEYSQAIEILNEAIQLDSKNSMAYFQRACAYAKLNQAKPMLADLNIVIELDPQNSMAYFDRGLAYQALGNVPAAAKDYQTAVQLDPWNQQARLRLEECQRVLSIFQY